MLSKIKPCFLNKPCLSTLKSLKQLTNYFLKYFPLWLRQLKFARLNKNCNHNKSSPDFLKLKPSKREFYREKLFKVFPLIEFAINKIKILGAIKIKVSTGIISCAVSHRKFTSALLRLKVNETKWVQVTKTSTKTHFFTLPMIRKWRWNMFCVSQQRIFVSDFVFDFVDIAVHSCDNRKCSLDQNSDNVITKKISRLTSPTQRVTRSDCWNLTCTAVAKCKLCLNRQLEFL